MPEANGIETVWLNARLATLALGAPGLGVIERGAVAARAGRIVFAGPEADLPAGWRAQARIVDCEGRWITPGLIDCHTHLVYAGDRAQEFEMRLAGATYEEIARRGGGILSTVRRHARSERRRSSLSATLRAARRADRRRRDHGRDQVRLRPRARGRAQVAARRAAASGNPPDRGPHDVSRRACAAAGIRAMTAPPMSISSPTR